ncbi:hypothetical protein POM88_020040 [Heracleum sosnowskyi]|uniref:Uncharacterized protein n=1 Tax=Heracleum sosnowskyi TaxID=360622 RepID=A0AAD8MMQ1_9APIA|nr:hypothetical protein POM88_020040 [Heracleum sosnowskyi]
MVPHVFEKLKTLDMSDSEDLTTTPDFKSFFQMYSQFGHPIHICSTKFPDWISKSTMYCRSTMYLDLPPNVSHKYLGMILCIRTLSYFTSYSVEKTSYYVKKTPSDVIWRGLFENYGYKKLMVIVPRSTFLVKDGDYSITVKVGPHVEIYGVHLLYGTEDALFYRAESRNRCVLGLFSSLELYKGSHVFKQLKTAVQTCGRSANQVEV